MSVLTPEELKCVVVLGSGSAGHRTLIAIIDRLVAEVASLRARNEALERVAKAAIARRDAISALDAARSTHARYCATNDLDDADRDIAALLSALNPSGPNSSGGET